MKKPNPIHTASRVLSMEAKAVAALIKKLDSGFEKAVEVILSATGKVIVTGMGKSGIVGQKIASTLASTGTSALFLHPAEGVHGDLGVIMKNDVLLALSNSGETEEILRIMPLIKRMGIRMIVMTGKKRSTLAGFGDAVIDIGVREEACPLGLSPTASTTAAMAMGDALAVALLERRGFRSEDFATLHPAGNLGRKLKKVEEFMHSGREVPRVSTKAPMKDALIEITAKRLGFTGVFEGRRLVGIITDGDLRRALERGNDLLSKKAGDVMTGNPKAIGKDALAEAALKLMEEHSITSLFVRDRPKGDVIGVVHLHDLIKAGVI